MKTYPLSILKQWERVCKNSKLEAIPDSISVTEFNLRVNTSYAYLSDGSIDHWQTPKEFDDRGAGDCEDFAIFKFFRLPYPRFLTVGILTTGEVHAVLQLYSNEFREWVALDNRTNNPVPWHVYTKAFKPVYKCDEAAVYLL